MAAQKYVIQKWTCINISLCFTSVTVSTALKYIKIIYYDLSIFL